MGPGRLGPWGWRGQGPAPETRGEQFGGRPEALWPTGAWGHEQNPAYSPRGLPQVSTSKGSVVGPWLDYLDHTATRS